ncbi:MAG: porin family protein [Mariprofundaceae bacterium]
MLNKCFLLTGVLFVGLVIAAPVKAANWAGSYIGANVGYGWGSADTDIRLLPSVAPTDARPITIKPSVNGAVAGGQVGYNWQNGNWVYGVEADESWSGMSDTAMSPIILNNGGTISPAAGYTAQQEINSFGTLRGRIGQDIGGDVLLYGTGGLAWGQVKTNVNTDSRPTGTIQYPASQSKTKTGWTVGAGAEWAFSPPYSVKIEYLYVDLGEQSVIGNPVPLNPPFQALYEWQANAHIVRAGINFLF